MVYVAKDLDGTTCVFLGEPKWREDIQGWDTALDSPQGPCMELEQEFPEIQPGQCVEVSLVPCRCVEISLVPFY